MYVCTYVHKYIYTYTYTLYIYIYTQINTDRIKVSCFDNFKFGTFSYTSGAETSRLEPTQRLGTDEITYR